MGRIVELTQEQRDEIIRDSANRELDRLKFDLFVFICRAPREVITQADLFLAWKLLDDECVRKRLEAKGLLEEADSIKQCGLSHWYLLRFDLADAIIPGWRVAI